MFSKSLFKQSCKANGKMWCVITVAVCFMLSCVMLIAGSGNLGDAKVAIQDTIIKDELTSQLQTSSINYYEIANNALTHFDESFAAATQKITKTDEFMKIYSSMGEEKAAQYAAGEAYKEAAGELQSYAAAVAEAQGYEADSQEAQEIQGVIFYTLNVMNSDEQGNVSYQFDDFFKALGEEVPRYDLTTIGTETRSEYREKYAMDNTAIFLAGNMIQQENVDNMIDSLSSYGVTPKKYEDFGFTDYSNIKEIARSADVEFRADLEFRLDNLKEGETPESVREDIVNNITTTLISSLPSEVGEALEELGDDDMYGIIVGSIFFKMAGLLLPIIYMIMTANALIAGQVDSGSMAYILSTSTKRRSVTFTQSVFLISSLLVMFLLTAITSVICLDIADVETELDVKKLLLINLGAFLVMFAMSGISFLASCWFDRSKNSMALGGGLNMFFLVATMLGLFGSPVLPSLMRMDKLNYFNYVSIISFFDVVSILDCENKFIWKFAVLFVIGAVCYITGSVKFRKKDLPL